MPNDRDFHPFCVSVACDCIPAVVRILVDYRPALRERTGVGEYIHQLVRAYTAVNRDEVLLFTSSWKDRPPARVEVKPVRA